MSLTIFPSSICCFLLFLEWIINNCKQWVYEMRWDEWGNYDDEAWAIQTNYPPCHDVSCIHSTVKVAALIALVIVAVVKIYHHHLLLLLLLHSSPRKGGEAWEWRFLSFYRCYKLRSKRVMLRRWMRWCRCRRKDINNGLVDDWPVYQQRRAEIKWGGGGMIPKRYDKFSCQAEVYPWQVLRRTDAESYEKKVWN